MGHNEIPGPGEYHLSKAVRVIKAEAPSFGMGSSKRTNFRQTTETPSPGTYKLPSLLGKDAPSYPMGQRRNNNSEDKEKRTIPGPNQYSPKLVTRKSPAFTITGRNGTSADSILREKKSFPGPGNYDTNKSTLDPHNFAKMGTEKRADIALGKGVPGPGQYNLNKTTIDLSPQPPVYSIGTQERNYFGKTSPVPGVGQYFLNKTMLSTKGGLMGEKISFHKRESSPGVGQYNIRDEQWVERGKMILFGKEKRRSLGNNNLNPSPGSYEAVDADKFKLRSNPKFTIGTCKRYLSDKSQSPGPQYYENKEIWNAGHGVTIGSKLFTEKVTKAPGPQHYRPSYTQVLPKPESYSTSKSEREGLANFKEKAKMPGPTDYNVGDIKTYKAPQYSFGKQERSQKEIAEGPGPGQYKISQDLDDKQSNFNSPKKQQLE